MKLKLEFPTNPRSRKFSRAIELARQMKSYVTWTEGKTTWHSVVLKDIEVSNNQELVHILKDWKATRVWIYSFPFYMIDEKDDVDMYCDLEHLVCALFRRDPPRYGIGIRLTEKDVKDMFRKEQNTHIKKARTPRDLFKR